MRNSRVPVLGTSRSRRGVAVVDIESILAGRSLIESPQDFVAMHSDHEPRFCFTLTLRSSIKSRIKSKKASAESAGGVILTTRFMEGPNDFSAVHWEHEPTPTPPRRGTGTTRTNTSFLLGRVGGGSVHGVPPMPPRGADAVSKDCPEACKALEVDYSHGAVHSGYWRCGGRSIPCADARSAPRCGPVLLPLVGFGTTDDFRIEHQFRMQPRTRRGGAPAPQSSFNYPTNLRIV